MNRITATLFYLAICVAARGQKNFTEAMQQGDTAFSNGQFKTAINKYFAAEAFDPSKKGLVKERVNRVFDNLEELRKQAELAKLQAVNEKERAEKAKREQVQQTNIALEEQRKLQALNSFMRYNNQQLFNEINRDKADMLVLKIKEVNLLNKYNDPSNDNTYRFYSLYLLSEYYERNKNLESAREWADVLCREYPDSAQSFMRRTLVNYYSGNWEKALADSDTCLLLNQDYSYMPVLKWNKGLIYCNLARHGDARRLMKESLQLLRQMPSEEVWGDDFMSEDISQSTSIYSIYMDRDYQLKTVETYLHINDLYAATAPVETLMNLNKKQLPLGVLLCIINFTSIHLKALPNQYICYLINGYMWELANYPEQAKNNYWFFLAQNKKQPNAKYNQYKNNFSSPLYNQLKKLKIE